MRKITSLLPMVFVAALGCGGDEEAGDRAQTIAGLSGNVGDGQAFYSSQCAVCHDANAMGIAGLGSDLTVTTPMLTDAEIAQTFLTPPSGMNSFAGSDNQTLADVIAYLRTL